MASTKPGNSGQMGDDLLEVEPQFGAVSDSVRRRAPSGLQCAIFCGGRRCPYEIPDVWDSTHMAVRGIYSHWQDISSIGELRTMEVRASVLLYGRSFDESRVTDDILAMARPCTEIINKKNVIRQFKSLGVRSLVNLQEPGEHSNCGCPIEPSGFTYDPVLFMDNGIYYYNFAWKDYGHMKVTRLLDMVKIMTHGLKEGKLAVHCHAGLGRTGVLIACFLVYTLKFRANEAIKFVRLKRPNSVQSRGQIMCVQDFERLLLKQPRVPGVNLPHYILAQKVMLHGFEARCIQHIPKIVCVVCERLLSLTGCIPVATIPDGHYMPTTMHFFTSSNNPNPCHYHYVNSYYTDQHYYYDTNDGCQNEDENEPKVEKKREESKGYERCQDLSRDNSHHRVSCRDVVEAMILDPADQSEVEKADIARYQASLNHGEVNWNCLRAEENLVVLCGLLTDWMEQLKNPIIHCELLCQVVIYADDPIRCLQKFDFVTQYTIEYLMRFAAHLGPMDNELVISLVQRLVAALTQQAVEIRSNLVPRERECGKLRRGTYKRIMLFLMNLLNQIKKP